jgi:hypothetical protein
MGVVDYTYYTNLLSSTQEAEAGLWIWEQLDLLSQNTDKKKKEKEKERKQGGC